MSVLGKYIVIEGAEGVGKTTIVQMLAAQLQAAQLPVKILREPDSQNDLTARAIRRLTQDPRYPMSTRTEVLLYNAARSQSLEVIRTAVANGVICLVDRSYLTTLAIQYYGRGDVPDYTAINDIINFAVGDMQPDLMLVLDAPASTLKERVRVRSNAERFDNLDEAFLERVRAGYLWEAKQRNLPVVYANEDVETVFKHVWQHVTSTLALRTGDTAASKPQSVGEVLATKPIVQAAAVEPPVLTADAPAPETPAAIHPEVKETESKATSTAETTKPDLATYITNADSPIYGFTNTLPPVVIAAAMARLSHSNSDMHTMLLDGSIEKMATDQQLLSQTINAYSDDAVQQLAGRHFIAEGASALLARGLELGRLASYTEQAAPYVQFDQKNTNGNYKFYIPAELTGKVRSQYIRSMNDIFGTYASMVGTLAEYIRKNSSAAKSGRGAAWQSATSVQARSILQDALPLAAKTTVGIFASGQALENLILHLQNDELAELRTAGAALLIEARKIIPVFLEGTAETGQNKAALTYRTTTRETVKNLANTLLPTNYTAATGPVGLAAYWPRNELDIVADMLYPHSDLPLEALLQQVSQWSYQQKLDVFAAYMGDRPSKYQRPGRPLEKIHYSFDLTAKYGVFKELQRHHMVDNPSSQECTPRLGYDVPQLVIDAGLAESFEHCFDLSLELYSALQAAKGPLLAQYAVLHGHNVRWQVTVNAREAFRMLELYTAPESDKDCRKIALQMYDKITEVHPLLAEAMSFVETTKATEPTPSKT